MNEWQVDSLLDRQKEAWVGGARPSVAELLKGGVFQDDPDVLLDLIYNEIVVREELGDAQAHGRGVCRDQLPHRQRIERRRVDAEIGRPHDLDLADGDAARVRALEAYKDFLALWKDSDPDIPILKQAKAEYAKLQ